MASDYMKRKRQAQPSASKIMSNYGCNALDPDRQNSAEINDCIRETGTKISSNNEINCFLWDSQKDPCYDLWHWHNEVQIIHVLEGVGYALQLKGEFIELEAPCILLIPGRTMHKIVQGLNGKINHLTFSPSLIELLHYDDALCRIMHPFTEGLMPCTPAIRPCDEGFVSLEMLVNYIESNLCFDDPGRKLQIKGCLLQIIGIMIQIGYIRLPNSDVSIKSTRHDDRMVRLLVYINENYNKEISVTDAAQMMGVSKAYFSRYFKAITSINFIDYLNLIRINKAAQDLISTDDNTDDIAKRHGFISKSYFFKIFKLHFHTTPYAFRKDRNGFAVFDPKIDSSMYLFNPIAGHFIDDVRAAQEAFIGQELGLGHNAEIAPFFPVEALFDNAADSPFNSEQHRTIDPNTPSYGLVPDLNPPSRTDQVPVQCSQESSDQEQDLRNTKKVDIEPKDPSSSSKVEDAEAGLV